MGKLGHVLVVIGIIGVVYILLLVSMPVLLDFASSANSTIIDTGRDMSRYPGAVEALIAAPWALFWAPAVVGMVVVVLILRA